MTFTHEELADMTQLGELARHSSHRIARRAGETILRLAEFIRQECPPRSATNKTLHVLTGVLVVPDGGGALIAEAPETIYAGDIVQIRPSGR